MNGPARAPRTVIAGVGRALGVLCLALVAAELVYVVAINVFLSTALFEKVVDADPSTIDVRYHRGWSVIPGRIHAEHLSIRGRDSHVEWILRLERVDFHVSFLAFARKRFRVLSAHGAGITFRLRQRVESPRATPEYVAKLPPIPGLPTLAFAPNEPPGPIVWSDAGYNLFTIDLAGLVADDVREVWIDTARFEGVAHIAGGFFLKPIRHVSVGPVHVDVTPGGRVAVAGVPAADAVSGSFDFTLTGLDPRIATGADLLHHMTLSTDLRASLPDLNAVPLWPEPGMVRGRVEARRVTLRVADGVLRDDTHLDLRGPALTATVAGHDVTGSIAVTADVSKGRLKACVDGADLRAVDLFGVSRLVACGDSGILDLAHPFTDVHGVVDAPAAVLPDARVVDGYIPHGTPLRVVAGRAEASLHAEAWADGKRATGTATLQADDLDMELATIRARGATTVDASVGTWSWATGHASGVHVAVAIADAAIATTDAPLTPMVRVRRLSLDAAGDDVDVADPLRALHATIAMPAGQVVDQVFLHAYLPKGEEMRIEQGRTRFDARCDVEIRDHRAAGTLDVHADRVGVAFRDLHLVADVTAHGRVHDWDWVNDVLAVDSARVDVGRIGVSRAAGPAAATVEHVRVTASSPRFTFRDPLARARLAVAIKGGKVDDPTAIDEFLPKGSTFTVVADDGAFDADFAADVTRHVAKGKLAVRAHGMGVSGRSVRIWGDVSVDADVARWDFGGKTIGVRHADVVVQEVAGALNGSVGASARGSGRPPGERSGPNVDFTADRVEVATSDASFDFAHPSLRGVDFRVRVGQADLPEARALNELLTDERLFAVESGSARISADVSVSPSKRAGDGRIDVTLRDAAIRFQKAHYGGQFLVEARVAGFDPDQGAIDLAGSRVEMRGVRVTGASTPTSAWEGDIALRSGTLRFDPAPAMTGALTIEARDARPALAILLGDSLPKFLVGLTDMPHLEGSAKLDLGPGLFVLSDFDARGGDIDVRGTYVVRDDHRHGAFVIAKGILSAGVRLADDGAHLRLFGLDGWLRDETRAALDAASCSVTTDASGRRAPSYCLPIPR